jgi:hypothetical protein
MARGTIALVGILLGSRLCETADSPMIFLLATSASGVIFQDRCASHSAPQKAKVFSPNAERVSGIFCLRLMNP